MSVQTKHTFTRYSLSEREELDGRILSALQEQVIQNQLSMIADTILNLAYDPSHPLEFVQQDAHAKGQMSVYRYLLDASEEAKKALLASINPSET